MPKQLRPYQAKAVSDLRQALASGAKRPVLKLSVGAGKTRIAAEVISLALDKRKRVIFTVPRISLVDQTVDAFLHEGIAEVGVIQQAHEMTDPSRPAQVASIDSLMRREIPPADLVIVDECHIQREFITDDWMRRPGWEKVPFIGLSATPWTKGMAKHWDALVPGPSMRALIDAGFLSPFRVFAPSHPDLDSVQTRAGDYVEGQLAKAMDKPKLVGDVVEHWLAHGEHRPTLCFGVNRAHAKHLAEKFEKAGVPSGYVDAYSDLDERWELERKFRAGEVRVACSVGVLTTGVDWPVACIILARPTRSPSLFVQIVGRGLRVNPGWSDCLIFDHASIHAGGKHSLGFVTDLDEALDTLDDGKERAKSERKDPLPQECPQCHFLKPPRVAVCPECGFKTEHKPKAVEIKEGKLVELTPRKLNRDMSWDEKIAFMGELRAIGLERGYRDGWAANKYHEKFGVWPNDPRVKFAKVRPPSNAVRNWVKSTQIAWAKRRTA